MAGHYGHQTEARRPDILIFDNGIRKWRSLMRVHGA